AGRESRAIAGKSSSGFGAMNTPMLRPDLFGPLATHAGDAQHELRYIPEFGKPVPALRVYGHVIMRWRARLRSRPPFLKPAVDAEVAKAGLPDDRVHFELFDAGHAAIDYRYPLALAWLAERLAR